MHRSLRSRSFVLCSLIPSLVLFLALALTFTDPAAANPGEDSMIYLPLVNSPLAPVDVYETDFTDSIGPWKAVRWQKGADIVVEHNDGCDSSHCGFLQVEVHSKDTYAIVSPLIMGPIPSYDILFRAKLKERKDKAQYGVIFGGDWQGAPCPGDNADACFNHYYEFRVRYRDVDGEKYMEYRIRRVDSHDGNNIQQGKDLVEWTRADSVDPDGFNKWEVHYGASGHMSVKANNHEQSGSARDTTYNSSRFFGVYARAGENGETVALFDRFRIYVVE